MNYTVRELGKEDIQRIAEIHHECLSDDFLPRLGVSFLRDVYYTGAIENDFGRVFVAETPNRELAGFINVGVDQSKYLKQILRKNAIKILKLVFLLLLTRPKIIIEAVRIANQNVIQPEKFIYKKGEIMFIAISPQFRGTGTAYELIKHSHQYLLNQNIQLCGAKTLKSNCKAIKFYEKNGYVKREKIICAGKEYVWLEWQES